MNEHITFLIKAIENFSSNQGALENFQSYLEQHYNAWREKYASTPEDFITELYQFSQIEA